eukprot:scaffold12730_cov69-Phaeocystis_antarctica.AAC.1
MHMCMWVCMWHPNVEGVYSAPTSLQAKSTHTQRGASSLQSRVTATIPRRLKKGSCKPFSTFYTNAIVTVTSAGDVSTNAASAHIHLQVPSSEVQGSEVPGSTVGPRDCGGSRFRGSRFRGGAVRLWEVPRFQGSRFHVSGGNMRGVN